MRRRAAIFWHAALSLAAGALYFGFVLPRWWELMGDTSHGLGTVVRIVAGILIALAALPVVFTLLELRKPEFGTPALALTLRTWSAVAHVVAGVLIVGTAISEIWLNLDSVGQWLFGVYGAAAAIALLGIAGFYLSFVAELPPPPPKPLKPKREKKQRRRRGKKDDEADPDIDAVAADPDTDPDDADDADDADDSETSEIEATDAKATEAYDESAEAESPAVEAESTPPAPAVEDDAEGADDADDTAESGGLRNRRPSGKGSGTHRRRRSRRGVTVDE
jgi:hypothetical protein